MKRIILIFLIPTIAIAQVDKYQSCADAGYAACQVVVGEAYADGKGVGESIGIGIGEKQALNRMIRHITEIIEG